MESTVNTHGYFQARGVGPQTYQDYTLPRQILELLPADKNISILDIGCGYCQMLKSLRSLGFKNLQGIDVSEDAVQYGLAQSLAVSLIDDLENYLQSRGNTYDLVFMSHVIEHINKDRIIDVLKLIRACALSPSGVLYLATPNAQAITDCYWAYEDFTHTTIFTGGSIAYVLRQAGYQYITFLDPNGLEYLTRPKRLLKSALQWAYRANRQFWNRIMNCSYHRPSPQIYSWELRLIAR